MIVEAAPAKINLALHVTGQRDDGYHLLQSLVSFTTAGDRLSFTPASEDRLTIVGRFAAALPPAGDNGNLVEKARDAARLLAFESNRAAPPVHIHLEKNLPVASGIGGGSADAAATLRGLGRLWGLAPASLASIALPLGADVPMCLAGHPLMAEGVGERLTPLALAPLFLVLANPLIPVSTPAVFRALSRKTNPPFALPAPLPEAPQFLADLRNDLQAPALTLVPEIGVILQSLAGEGAWLSRMSGSGATCFGLFTDAPAAENAAAALRSRHPDWYIEATETRAGG